MVSCERSLGAFCRNTPESIELCISIIAFDFFIILFSCSSYFLQKRTNLNVKNWQESGHGELSLTMRCMRCAAVVGRSACLNWRALSNGKGPYRVAEGAWLMVLVDTTVWIDFFTDRNAPHVGKLQELIESEEDISKTAGITSYIMITCWDCSRGSYRGGHNKAYRFR